MNELQVIEKNNERVLLTSQIAESYGTTAKVISNNFNNNKERYIEGKHFYCLTGNNLKEFMQSSNLGLQNSEKIRTLYLWTQKGALLHAKSLGTDKAWEVYDYLVDSYFEKYKMNNVDSYMIENPIERAKRWIEEQQEKIELMEKISYLEPKAKISDKRIDKLGCYSISEVNKSLHIKQGKLSRWAKFLGFIHKTQNEVNQKGDEYFKVYCKDGKHNQIGITEKGLELINKEIDTIRNIDQIIKQ